MPLLRTLFLLVPCLALVACASAPKPESLDFADVEPRATPPALPETDVADVPEDFDAWQHSEETPVIAADELLVPALLKGPFHEVDARVPVSGSMAVFTLRTPFGEKHVEGVEMLAIRVSELPAIDRLSEQSGLRTFVDATGAAAARTARAMANVLGDPVGTVQNLPRGVARFFRKTYRSIRRTTLDVSDAARERMADEPATAAGPDSEGDRTEPSGESGAGEAAESLTLRYIGYHRARRDLAKRLEVDPYTTNVLLNAQLDQLAWSGLAGRVTFGAALGAAGAVAEVASVSGRLNRLVWELSPEEIRDRNERHLAAAGFEGMRVRAFLRNRAFHPSLQLDFTAALLSLEDADGRFEFIDLAAEASNELEARFLVNFLRMAQLTQDQDGAPVVRIVIDGEAMWVTTAEGSPVLLLPVDYLSATSWLQALLEHPRLIGRRVTLRVGGIASSEARRRIEAAGWRMHTLVPYRDAPSYLTSR